MCMERPWAPSLLLQNPGSPALGIQGMEQGEQHRPNHLLIPHKASKNVIFACNLSRMHCAVCPPHAHPTCLSPTVGTARGSSSTSPRATSGQSQFREQKLLPQLVS